MQWENNPQLSDDEFVERWQQDLRLTEPAGSSGTVKEALIRARERRLTRLALAAVLGAGFLAGVIITVSFFWLSSLPQGSLVSGLQLVHGMMGNDRPLSGELSLVWSGLLWVSLLFSLVSGVAGFAVVGFWQRFAHRREG